MEHSLPATDGDDEIQTIPVRHQVGESQTLTIAVDADGSLAPPPEPGVCPWMLASQPPEDAPETEW